MLEFYIDDSGKEHDSYSFVLAGYMASTEAWLSFGDQWQRVLDSADVSAFHMVDAWRIGRNYQHLGVLGRNQLVQDLLSCITKHVERAFVLSIDMESYCHWFARREEPDLVLTRPYYVGFHAIQLMISSYIYNWRDDNEYKIILDEQGGESLRKLLETVIQLRDLLATQLPHMRLTQPTFETDLEVLPLQAADMLAWLCRRENHNYRNGIDLKSSAESLWLSQALSMPAEVKIMGDKILEPMATHMASLLEDALEKKPKN